MSIKFQLTKKQKEILSKKLVLRRNLILETCGQGKMCIMSKGSKYFTHDHKSGCYIRFKSNCIISCSEERDDVIIDRDKKGRIVGIEFYEGL